MANDKNQTELNSLKIFGDLEAGDPNVATSDNLKLFPLLSDINDLVGEDAGLVQTLGTAGKLWLLKTAAFSKEHLLVTDLGLYRDTDIYSWQSGMPNKTKLKYDPIRQSLGSVRCIATNPFSLIETAQSAYAGKATLSFIRNTLIYNTAGALGFDFFAEPEWANMPVFNPQRMDVALENMDFSGAASGKVNYWNDYNLLNNPTHAHPTAPFCKSYQNIGLERIGISDKIRYNQSGLETFFAKEAICIFTDDFKENSGGYGAQGFPDSALLVNFSRQMALLNLFFTADQKREGVNLASALGSAYAEKALETATAFGSLGGSEPTQEQFIVGYGTDDENMLYFTPNKGFNGSEVVDFSFWEDLISVAATKQGSNAANQALTAIVVFQQDIMTKMIEHFSNNIQYNEGDPSKGKRLFYDHSFSCKKAVDYSYNYLLPDHAQSSKNENQPVAEITPRYNYLSLKYETAMSSAGRGDLTISEKVLPNIYMFEKCKYAGYENASPDYVIKLGIQVGSNCHEKYNFEKYGSKILDYAKLSGEIAELNEEFNTKRMSNIIVKALQSVGDPQSSTPPGVKNSVNRELVEYPMYIDINFSGDELDPDKDNRSLFNEPENDAEAMGIRGEEMIKEFHSSGIVHEFIKSLIYYQFSGQNATNPPSTDPEKFALFSSMNLIAPAAEPGINRVVAQELPENDSILGGWSMYPDKIFIESENQGIYNFDEWVQTLNVENGTLNSIMGQYMTGTSLYDMKDIKKTAIDVTEPGYGKETKIYENWFENTLFLQNLPKFISDYINFRNGATRSYKQCVSKTLDRDGNIRYLNSVQGTLFYRIAKYDTRTGELIQNIFIPALSANTKLSPPGPPQYRYIDTQVKYGKVYRYKISAYKIVFGTEYSYDFAPYDNTSNKLINYNETLDGIATALGYDIESKDDTFYRRENVPVPGFPSPDTQYAYSPVYSEPSDAFLEKAISGFEEETGNVPLAGVSMMFKHTQAGNDLTMFSVSTKPSVKIFEVPFFEDYQVVILDKPPISPLVNIHPLVGKKDKLLISFENQTGTKHEVPIKILESDYDYFELERIGQKKAIIKKIKGEEDKLYFPKLEFKSDGFPSAYEVFRLDGIRPTSYSDFASAKYGKVLVKNATSFEDEISTNVEYYYTFRTIDIHGNISNPTPVYSVKMVEDSGAVYPLINVVNLEGTKDYVGSREFNRYLQIDVADIHKYLNFQKSGLTMNSAINNDIQPHLSMGSDGDPWNNQLENGPNSAKRFKFRVKSKQTGKIIDLNVGFHVRHENPSKEPNACNDAVPPTKPGNTKGSSVNEAHTENVDSYFNNGKEIGEPKVPPKVV